MIGLDTNVLVYARRAELAPHEKAYKLLLTLAQGDQPWALFWPCIYEFLRVVTHPRVFDPPTNLSLALEDMESLMDSPTLTILGEGPTHFSHLSRTLTHGAVIGNLVHDGHIAALAIEHGIKPLITADRDFSRFTGLVCENPFAKA